MKKQTRKPLTSRCAGCGNAIHFESAAFKWVHTQPAVDSCDHARPTNYSGRASSFGK